MSSTTSERRRILVLIKGLGVGGAERLVAEAAPLWNREAFEYAVAYLLPWKDQLAGSISVTGVPVTCVGGPRGTDARSVLRLHDLVADWRPDLIHAHLPYAGIISRLTTRKPIVYTEHNIVGSYRQPTRSINRLTYRRNRSVIAVSEAVAGSLTGYPGPKPLVIPNGVTGGDLVNTDGVRAELGISDSTPLVVHVGNIRPLKGHNNLIGATVELANDWPDILVVSIGGEKHQGDLEHVQRRAADAGVSSNIRFLGRRDDARRFLAAADVVVNPSDAEGLPVSILEALSQARPVVATDVGGVSSVIIHEKTGLLVEPGNPSALASATTRALTDPAAADWGRAGARLVATGHSLQEMVIRYEKVYQQVLNG